MTPLQTALALARIALRFGRVERITRHEDGIRPETDADHTVMLGLIALALDPLVPIMDPGLIAQFALVHDLVEAYTGDTPTLVALDRGERAAKKAREEAALRRIASEIGDDSIIVRLIQQYEAQEITEARYIRLLDKAMPKLTHMLNAFAVVQECGLVHADLQEIHRKQLAELSAEYPEFMQTLRLLHASMDAAEEAYPPSDARDLEQQRACGVRFSFQDDESVTHADDGNGMKVQPHHHAGLFLAQPSAQRGQKQEFTFERVEMASQLQGRVYREVETPATATTAPDAVTVEELFRAAFPYLSAPQATVRQLIPNLKLTMEGIVEATERMRVEVAGYRAELADLDRVLLMPHDRRVPGDRVARIREHIRVGGQQDQRYRKYKGIIDAAAAVNVAFAGSEKRPPWADRLAAAFVDFVDAELTADPRDARITELEAQLARVEALAGRWADRSEAIDLERGEGGEADGTGMNNRTCCSTQIDDCAADLQIALRVTA